MFNHAGILKCKYDTVYLSLPMAVISPSSWFKASETDNLVRTSSCFSISPTQTQLLSFQIKALSLNEQTFCLLSLYMLLALHSPHVWDIPLESVRPWLPSKELLKSRLCCCQQSWPWGEKENMETGKSILMASIIFIPFYNSLFVFNIFINSENWIQCILVIFTFYSYSRIDSHLPYSPSFVSLPHELLPFVAFCSSCFELKHSLFKPLLKPLEVKTIPVSNRHTSEIHLVPRLKGEGSL